ncbi:hypothetical protein [Psychrobacter sp. I-STPA6b]|uniref:hypothetical protein n=1 Tax=Psychrobacter sp. I-STPA6b TaxID=2585718 RepID=UPI001D0C2630|nr:hypothetical protein [Psychrobacter sp. I-STPA6b]
MIQTIKTPSAFSMTISIMLSSLLTLTACQTSNPAKIPTKSSTKTGSDTATHIPSGGIELDYKILLNSSYDDFGSTTKSEAYQKVIDDSQTFQQEFAKFSNALAPSIDFSKQRVVMDSLGLLYSGSMETTVKQVYDDGEFVHVIFLHTSRDANCPVTMALSRPHVFISLENTRPIKIHTESMTETCD